MLSTLPSPLARSKRYLDEADCPASVDSFALASVQLSKRVRLQRSPAAGRCGLPYVSEPSAAYAAFTSLRALFPDMDDKVQKHELRTVSSVLVECGNDIDAAIKRLTGLRLSTEDATVAAATAAASTEDSHGPASSSQQAAPVQTPQQQQPGIATLQTGEQWVEYMIAEMSAALGMEDAKQRAAAVLQNFERFMRTQNKEQEVKDKLAAALNENFILKKAVLLQNKKLAEKTSQDSSEVEQLRHALSQYQEQLRKLEMHNYSLTLHLQQATNSKSDLDMTGADLNAHAERFVKLYAKAARAMLGWSGVEAQLFIKLLGEATDLDKEHVADLKEEADKHRRLLSMKKQAGPSSSKSQGPVAAPGAAAAAALTRIGKALAETQEFVFDPAAQIGVGIDPGVTQAVSAALGGVGREVRPAGYRPAGPVDADQGPVKQASGLNNARRNTERWLAPIEPHLQHLAAASSAGTSLEANLKHITVTLATWDAVWQVYLDSKCAWQRLRLYGAQDRALEQFFMKLEEEMAELSMKRHIRAKQLVEFFGAASIGIGVAPRKPPQAPCSSQTEARQKAKPAPQPGRWLDRDCNAEESRWRPLELCYCLDQPPLPAKGME
ncbi:hypothetical protein QJQ45_001665 [Haematococcus lacustris]|nr:hypothetical protein QJQ45_001665 [Haematococcus lacustris]